MHRLIQSKNNIRALELRRYLGVCHRIAWMVKHRPMGVMRLREDRRQLTGRVGSTPIWVGALGWAVARLSRWRRLGSGTVSYRSRALSLAVGWLENMSKF